MTQAAPPSPPSFERFAALLDALCHVLAAVMSGHRGIGPMLVFIRAFHTGRIFDHGHIQDPQLRRIQHRPLRYGSGMMAMGLPKILSPLVPAPLILGHTGVHGAFAFYCPSRSAFIAGSVNSIVTPPATTLVLRLTRWLRLWARLARSWDKAAAAPFGGNGSVWR